MRSAARSIERSDPLEIEDIDARDVARVAATAWTRVADIWQLDNASAAALVGVSLRTWARMKKPDWSGRLNQDQLLRVSALVGLYKALHLYFSDELADHWPTLPNTGPLFVGSSPVDTMLTGGLPRVLDVRNYVDALRGSA